MKAAALPRQNFPRGSDEDSYSNGISLRVFLKPLLLLVSPPTSATMSVQEIVTDDPISTNSDIKELPFPPVTKEHILNCSYHKWHPQ